MWVTKKDLYGKTSVSNRTGWMRYSASVTKDQHLVANMACISDSTDDEQRWYFDSGCSKHMTGDKTILSNYSDSIRGSVMYGDGWTGCIIGKRSTININTPH